MFFLFLGAREVFESPELERFAHALETLQRRYPAITLGTATARRLRIVDRSPGQAYPTIARQIDLLGQAPEAIQVFN